MAPMHAIIAGAGVGGLTAALALARAGLRVTLLERAPLMEDAGAGIQLAPNATGALRELGLLDRLARHATTPEQLRIRRGSDGKLLALMPLGPIADFRWGAPWYVLHRGDLIRALVEACAAEPAIALRSGLTVTGFAVAADGVEVGARDNDELVRVAGDVLIGADGLKSLVRGRIGLGLSDLPVWSGRTAWRALVPAHEAPPMALRLESNLWLGRNAHLVHYPVRNGDLINVVAIAQDPWRAENIDDLWSIAAEPAEISPGFGNWCEEARALVSAAREWRRWPLFDRNPVRRWHGDRVALLGDAAHPMLPFLAQGAGQAIEDAMALGQAFRAHGANFEAALKAYEASRAPRASAVVIASRRQGSVYHMGGPMGFARDMVMKRLSPEQMMARMDWLYNYAPAK